MQDVTATILAQLVTVKKKVDVVNVDQNIKSPTVCHVHSVTLAIQIVNNANVTSMVLKVTSVNHRTVNARVNKTLPETFVNVVLTDSMDPNVYHVIVIRPVQ